MITSKTNEIVKYVKSLHAKKFRDEFGVYIIEGKKIVKEAIETGVEIEKIIICEKLLEEKLDVKEYEVVYVSENVFEYISDIKTPQGILAIIKKPRVNIENDKLRK